MNKENTIQLMRSKLQAYKNGYLRATSEGDRAASKKWKDGYESIREEIAKLEED